MPRRRWWLGLCLGVSLEPTSRLLVPLGSPRPRGGPLGRAPRISRASPRSGQGIPRQHRHACRQWSSRSLSSRVGRSATPLVGAEAPPFTAKAVVDREFLDVSLSQYWGEKYVVLFFYPLDFSTICPTEIIAFSDRYEEFANLGAEVLGVSVDSEYAHRAWIEMPRESGGLGNVSFPLVSDLRKEIATAYEVLGPDGTAMRGLFIIDKEGIIQHSTINNLAFARNIDEALRVLQMVQFVKDNPDEVCPEGWLPGNRSAEVGKEPLEEAEEKEEEEKAEDEPLLPMDIFGV